MAKGKTTRKPKQSIIEPPLRQEDKTLVRFIPKNDVQRKAWREIHENDFCFLTGIAGGGKTFIAIAYGVTGLLNGTFEKLVLTRPAIESGEKLGFLPGEMGAKMLPFLAPVMDAVNKFTNVSESAKDKVKASVDVVPLAYARGRTFEKSFCILDESQNATPESIEMYMTRLGEGSKMVLCGDDGQPDIDRCVLNEVAKAFSDAGQAGWCAFGIKDSVRHPRIGKIIEIMSRFKRKR